VRPRFHFGSENFVSFGTEKRHGFACFTLKQNSKNLNETVREINEKVEAKQKKRKIANPRNNLKRK
jgi:hypothetical protein